jgi:hypothetical protein
MVDGLLDRLDEALKLLLVAFDEDALLAIGQEVNPHDARP